MQEQPKPHRSFKVLMGAAALVVLGSGLAVTLLAMQGEPVLSTEHRFTSTPAVEGPADATANATETPTPEPMTVPPIPAESVTPATPTQPEHYDGSGAGPSSE